MTTYFDPVNDLALLPKSIRDDNDLVNICARAERDLIGKYIVSMYRQGFMVSVPHPPSWVYPGIDSLAVPLPAVNGNSFDYVCLRNFTVDASACQDAYLVAAMKDEIAELVRWRTARSKHTPGVEQEIAGGDLGTQRTYTRDVDALVPTGCGWRLRRWDLRPKYMGV